MRPFSRWGAPLACLLVLPALGTGLVIDDYLLRLRVHDANGIRWQGLLDTFSLVERHGVPALRELGELPWWSDPDLTLRFFRPLAALTHALDFAWLSPFWMHVESMLLLALLNVLVALWYRRWLGEASALATALFALAPGHIYVASWIANRNALLAALFGVGALLLYERARSQGRSVLPATLLYALGLLSGEIGVCTLGLLIAYALCLDQAPRPWRALAPAFLLTGGWGVAHQLLGYGARESPLYVSPLEPRFVLELAAHVPTLLFGQWGVPAIGLSMLLARPMAWAFTGVCLLCLALWAPRVITLAKAEPRARFGLVGSLLAVLPVSATVPHDRLLIIADIAGLGLLALAGARFKKLMRARLALAALLGLASAASLREHHARGSEPFAEVLREPSVAQQSVVLMNAPVMYYAIQLPWLRAFDGGPSPKRLRTLVPGLHTLTLERRDARTLRVHADGGLFQPLGTGAAWVSPDYVWQLLNQFTRARWAYRPGDVVALSDLTVRVVSAPGGYPETVDFTFRAPLAQYRFMQWRDGRYEPWLLPDLGTTGTLAAQQP